MQKKLHISKKSSTFAASNLQNTIIMAKQSGLHQIKGKVGEHSYYSQTGVVGGLIRSINQGLSQKVKTSDAFANTRLNNSEFGQAGRIASMLGHYITPKYRPMILPFSQSKMAKIILDFIKGDTTAPWGQRNITTENSGEAQVEALNAVSKNAFADYGVSIAVDEEQLKLTLTGTAQTLAKLNAIGASDFAIRFIASTSWIGKYSAFDQKYFNSYARGNIYDETGLGGDGDETTITYTLRPAPQPTDPVFQAERMGIVILMPRRIVNSEEYILQEYCTYYAFVLEDGRII